MKDLYKAIDALNEISQAERDAMRAQMDAEKAAVRAAADAEKAAVMKAAGRAPITKADMYKDVADFAKQQRAASKAAGYATKAEYDAAYQQNLDNLAKAGVNMDDVYAAANKMMSTEKGAARLAKMGIQDDDDLISYAMAKAGIKDVTPDKYTATDYAITDIPEDELTFETEESLEERVTYSTLAKLSGIKNPDKIYLGQKITLPGGGSYTVKRGDTLSGIAQDFRLGKIGQSGKLDDPTTKLPQISPKADASKLDDPTTKLPQVTKPEPGQEPGDFEINRSTDAGDDEDSLNKYDMDQAGNYKLDPKSVVQPEKKKSDSLYKQFTNWAKGTKWYDIATSNPEPEKIPATVQGRKVDLANPRTAGVDLGDYGDTSKMSVMDLAKKIQADPTWNSKSDAEKKAENDKLAAYTAAQRDEIYKRIGAK